RPSLPSLPAPAFSASRPVDAQAVAAEGVRLAADALPDWHQFGDAVVAEAAQRPRVVGAIEAGDSAAVAQALGAVYASVQASNASRQMKLNAQSMVGASGRPPGVPSDAAEWNAIV